MITACKCIVANQSSLRILRTSSHVSQNSKSNNNNKQQQKQKNKNKNNNKGEMLTTDPSLLSASLSGEDAAGEGKFKRVPCGDETYVSATMRLGLIDRERLRPFTMTLVLLPSTLLTDDSRNDMYGLLSVALLWRRCAGLERAVPSETTSVCAMDSLRARTYGVGDLEEYCATNQKGGNRNCFWYTKPLT